ncbi:MAG TPA: site-2 protease family protein [Candidatus Saccharimonadales bacterium]|nr:site-2 protease family protein [Candidatus Saccharimonadales bacterium]
MLSNLDYADIPIVLAVLLISLGLHEAMHAFAAHRLGDNTALHEGRLTLNPLKHVDLMTTVLLPLGMMLLHLPPILIARPVPFDPEQVKYGEYGSALIALAGPFTNLGIAAASALLLRTSFVGSGFPAEVLIFFLLINVSLFVFNMLPIPPLDGSRLLYAFAPEPVQKVMYQIEAMGFVFLIVVLLVLMQVGLGNVLVNLNQSVLNFLL